MPVTYIPIASTTLGSPTLSVTFSSIPSTYTDLVLVVSMYEPTNWGSGVLVINSDTGTNYSSTRLGGDGSTAFSARQSNVSNIYPGQISNGTIFIFNIQNYANTNVNKTIISRGNGTGQNLMASVSLWRSTSAINSLQFSNGGGINLPTGATFSLYGVASTAVGAKATGGTIFNDGTYYYHTFTSSGTFTPTQSISADILVVAGGGGSGAGYGTGGGGAGGLAAYSSQSLTATGYTVTVGSGGAGSGNAAVRGSNGVDSQFGALTAAVGGGGGASSNTGGTTPGNGGSGGGATAASSVVGTGTSGQGFAGGSGGITGGGSYGGGGAGGGAGALGGAGTQSGTSASGGTGGIGLSTYSSWGLATGTGQNVSGTVYYAGGGGGGAFATTVTQGLGGSGGGGGGGYNSTVGTAGRANTGGGGGGAALGTGGNNGGSGLVIVRYPI